MLKYLRIAVTALGLTACVLLVALWVRSYYRYDDVKGGIFTFLWSFESLRGEFGLVVFDPNDGTDDEPVKVVPHVNTASVPVSPTRLAWYDSGEPLSSAFAFRWRFVPKGFVIAISYWFLVVLSIVAAAFMSFGCHWQFSLRTLLIATTLVAVALGVVVEFR